MYEIRGQRVQIFKTVKPSAWIHPPFTALAHSHIIQDIDSFIWGWWRLITTTLHIDRIGTNNCTQNVFQCFEWCQKGKHFGNHGEWPYIGICADWPDLHFPISWLLHPARPVCLGHLSRWHIWTVRATVVVKSRLHNTLQARLATLQFPSKNDFKALQSVVEQAQSMYGKVRSHLQKIHTSNIISLAQRFLSAADFSSMVHSLHKPPNSISLRVRSQASKQP